MPLRLLGDRILIRRVRRDAQTEHGIFLPENSRLQANRGEVVFVGTGRTLPNGKTISSSVSVGDLVLFSETRHQETFVYEGEKFLVMDEDRILAILEKDE